MGATPILCVFYENKILVKISEFTVFRVDMVPKDKYSNVSIHIFQCSTGYWVWSKPHLLKYYQETNTDKCIIDKKIWIWSFFIFWSTTKPGVNHA